MSNRVNAKGRVPLRVSMRSICGLVLGAVALTAAVASAQGNGLSGKQVVEAVCVNCHATGVDGAPRIGDETAWKARSAQGLTSLSQHALQGLRKMPPHGGNPGLSDLDIKRATTYMVNQSGGHWIEPAATGTALRERSGEQIVNAQCVKCHEAGVDGAPRIGDLAAWAPRFARGIDVVIRSAINGHGAMHPRGGMADLTDSEMRVAALYMLNKGIVPAAGPPVAKAANDDRHHRVVEGMDVYLGAVTAESIRAKHPAQDKEHLMHGGIPRGKGYYHINISLLDSNTGHEIKDARVELSIVDPVTGDQTKLLEPISFNGATSYGNYFRMPEKYGYKITALIYRNGQSRAAKAGFDFRPE